MKTNHVRYKSSRLANKNPVQYILCIMVIGLCVSVFTHKSLDQFGIRFNRRQNRNFSADDDLFPGYNGTHLWSLPLADERYNHLASRIPCRTLQYHGGSKFDLLNSCDRSINNEFSVKTTLHAQRWIYNHQNPRDCSNKKFAIIEKFTVSGYGSTLHQIAWAFGKSLTGNRIAIYETPGNWVYADCPLSTPECVFLPITHCEIPKNPEKDQVIQIQANIGHWRNPILPEVFRNFTFNWYRAQLIFYLMRFKPETLEKVQAIIRRDIPLDSIHLHRPYIALYVRRSDKVHSREMSQAYRLDDYFKLFDADARRANINRIFINSEDESIFTEFHEFYMKTKNYYQLLSINTTRNAILSTFLRTPANQRSQLTIEFLTDLYIEVNADLHAGTLTSNWCRLVDEHRLVLGKIIPFYTPENKYYLDF